MKKVIRFIKVNRVEVAILITILLLALSLRLFRISDYMTFLGDEGRDAIVVKDILVNHHFPLLGPVTSIGNMYLGPLYYYMMAVSMTIGWLNPVAAAVMVSLIGTATVGLIYFLARSWFGVLAAFVASLLYAISPVNIFYSRSSWNPNPAPFFTLLGMFGFYQWLKNGDARWLMLVGASLAFAVQMHYLALILLPIWGLLWLHELNKKIQKKASSKFFWLGTFLSILIFLILMSPLVIFDLRHDYMNWRAVSTFFLGDRATTVNLNIFNTLGRIWPIYTDTLIGRYLAGENNYLELILSILLPFPLILAIYRRVKYQQIVRWHYVVLGVWLVIGVAGLSLYKQTIYDHYLGFLNPVIYLLLAAVVGIIWGFTKRYSFIGKGLLIVLICWLVAVNLSKNPLSKPPNMQLQRTQKVAKLIIEKATNQPFNFALIAKHNYDAAYQYYLDLYGYKPKQLPFDKTDQLLVVCEDQICNPVGHSKYEIAAFGWTMIDFEQEFEGLKIYRLVQYQEGGGG